MPLIENPNTSGQGFCAGHTAHPFHATALQFGYVYTHSVFVGGCAGHSSLYHCYKHGEHNLSFASVCNDARTEILGSYYGWQTSTSCGSGHKYGGISNFALVKHLKGKRNRYAELKGEKA